MDITINKVFHRVPGHSRTAPFGVTPEAIDGNDVMEYTMTGTQCGGGGANGDFVDHLPNYEFHVADGPSALSDQCPGHGEHAQAEVWIDPGHRGI